MDKKYLILIAFILAVELFAAPSCLAKAPKQAKAKYGVCDVVLERLENKKKSYILQAGRLNRKMAQTQKKLVRLKKNIDNKKYSKQKLEKQVKNIQDAESEMDELVISFTEVQDMSMLADKQIEYYCQKKDQMELAVEVEAQLGIDRYKTADMTSVKAPGALSREQQASEQPDYAEYKISAHDELQINVYGEPDLTKTARVSVDGSMSYPLLGKIKVEGLSAQELEEKLSQLFIEGGYIVNPQVSVYVERFSSVSILGEVRNPGSYELKGRLSIMDAIAQAGGFNINADINNVKILRIDRGQQRTIPIKLGDIKKGMEGVEIALKPNDTIFVEKIGKVTVLGEVTRPGTFELKDKITVLEAIAMAGGFTDIASINSTRIIRVDPSSKKKVLRVCVTDVISRGKKEKDLELLPGDIIYVPESFF